MMDHDERVCPRCGERAANCRFCPSCGFSIGSAPETPAQAESDAGDVSRQLVYDPLKALSIGHVPTAESNGIGDRIAGEPSAVGATAVGFDRSPAEATAVEPATTVLESAAIPAGSAGDAHDPSQPPAQEPLAPPAFGQLSAPGSNGIGDHNGDDTAALESTEMGFDRFEEADTAVEAPAEIAESDEVPPAAAEEETRDPDRPPVQEPTAPVAFGSLSTAHANGDGEQDEAETPADGDSDIDFDQSAAEDTETELIGAEPGHPFASGQRLAELGHESTLVNVDQQRDQAQPGAHGDDPRSVVGLSPTRSATSQRVAWLAAAIGLLLLFTGRALRRHV